jgi:hypothetical protein
MLDVYAPCPRCGRRAERYAEEPRYVEFDFAHLNSPLGVTAAFRCACGMAFTRYCERGGRREHAAQAQGGSRPDSVAPRSGLQN